MEVIILELSYISLMESRMMTGDETWSLDEGCKEVRKVHDIFCTGLIWAPLPSVNCACVEGLGTADRKDRVLKRVMRYWLRLLETDETNTLGDALGQQKGKEGGQLDEQN
jgi:hypothetical protein